MFHIHPDKVVPYKESFIGVSDYKNIECEDGERPLVICTYLNKNKHRIIGHFIDRDIHYHEERYLFVFITPIEYKLFINKGLSYYKLLYDKDIYIQDVAQMYTRTPSFTYYQLCLQDIPIFFWPSASSYCIEREYYATSAKAGNKS